MIFINLLKAIRFTYPYIKKQNSKSDIAIDSYLSTFYQNHRSELNAKSTSKIRKYYVPVSLFISTSYARIYNRKLTPEERYLAILMGIFVPLVDDFTDNNSLDAESINRLLVESSDYEPKTLEEDIVKSINTYFLENIKSPDGYLEVLKNVISAQHWSKKQMDSNVTRDELLEISLSKGGWSLVILHYMLDEVPSKQVIETLYCMGSAQQLCNDIFDVHKDFKEGIATYANTCDDFGELEKSYTAKCKEFVKLARALPYKKSDLDFFVSLNALIMARGIVALRMLSRLQKRLGGGVLPIEKLDRKALICDMEKPINVLRMFTIAFALQLNLSKT